MAGRYQVQFLIELIEGLIDQRINEARPGHQKAPRDDRNYREEIEELLFDMGLPDDADG